MLNIIAIVGLFLRFLPGLTRFLYPYWLSAGGRSRFRWPAPVAASLALSTAGFGRIAPHVFSAYHHDPFRTGTGISIYQLTYFVVDKIFIHHPIKVFNKTSRHVYLMAHYLVQQVLRRSSLKNQADRFGLSEVPVKYLTLAQRNNKHF